MSRRWIPVTKMAVLLWTAMNATAQAAPDIGPFRTVEFQVDQATWLNLDVSPDGKTLLLDILGDLYTLPIGGGQAQLLLGGRSWDSQARWSPDGRWVAFVSDRIGKANVWVMRADGTGLRQVSDEKLGYAAQPAWTPEGLYIVASVQTRSASELRLWHRDGGSGATLMKAPEGARGLTAPSISPDGHFVYGTLPGWKNSDQLLQLDRSTGEVRKMTVGEGGGMRGVVSPNGRWLAYARRNREMTQLHLRDLQSGTDRVLIPAITKDQGSAPVGPNGPLPAYDFTPDGKEIVITLDGRIFGVDVATGARRPIPFQAQIKQELAQTLHPTHRIPDTAMTARLIRWPSLSPDGKRVAFSALGAVWTTALPSGTPRQISNPNDLGFAPTFSPDGKSIAYVTWNDSTAGHLVVMPAAGGKPRVLTPFAGRYASPAWSADGKRLAFVADPGMELRGQAHNDADRLELRWIDVASGTQHTIMAVKPMGFANRYYPRLTFTHGDTRILFLEASESGAWGPRKLMSVRLDGTDAREWATVPAHFDDAIPSPDGRYLAGVHEDNVWVTALPPLGAEPVTLDMESPHFPVRQFTVSGGGYPAWRDSSTLVWSFVNELFQQAVDLQGAGAPTRIGTVQLQVERAAPQGTVAFTRARIVTMRGDEVFEDGVLVVKNNRIVSVGKSDDVSIPADARVMDMAGRTIVPGMIDTHLHINYDEPEYTNQARWRYIASMAYGVTTAFDPSAHSLEVFSLAEMVESGRMVGPRIFSTGDVLTGGADARSKSYPAYQRIESLEDARRNIKRLVDYGAIMIKEYEQPRRDQRQYILQAAREYNVGVTAEGHIDLLADMTIFADGYTAYEHNVETTPLYGDVLKLMAESGTHYTPTLLIAPRMEASTWEDYFYFEGRTYHDDPKLRRFVPQWRLDKSRRWTNIPAGDEYYLSVARDAAAVEKAGGKVDMGSHGQLPGLGSHWEMWALSMGGLEPMQALRAATLRSAQKLGLDRDLGSLEVGKLADFMVIDGNPLQDLRQSAKVVFTVKNGFVYDASDMSEVWPQKRALPKMYWQVFGSEGTLRADPEH